jgi:mRNA interferase RelE/StbE
MHRVTLSDIALEDLENLPRSYQQLIVKRITALAPDPRPRGSKKLGDRIYRVRQGPYRVLYEVHDEALEIVILRIRPRREAYR